MLLHGALISAEGGRCHPSEGLPSFVSGHGVLRLNMTADETPGTWPVGEHGPGPRPPALAASGSPAVHGHLGQGLGPRGLYLQDWWPASGSTGSQPASACDPRCWVSLWEVAKTALAPGRAVGLCNTVERGPQLLLGRPRASFVAGQGPLGAGGAESACLGRIPRGFRRQGYQAECPLGSWGWPGPGSL